MPEKDAQQAKSQPKSAAELEPATKHGLSQEKEAPKTRKKHEVGPGESEEAGGLHHHPGYFLELETGYFTGVTIEAGPCVQFFSCCNVGREAVRKDNTQDEVGMEEYKERMRDFKEKESQYNADVKKRGAKYLYRFRHKPPAKPQLRGFRYWQRELWAGCQPGAGERPEEPFRIYYYDDKLENVDLPMDTPVGIRGLMPGLAAQLQKFQSNVYGEPVSEWDEEEQRLTKAARTG